MFLKIMSQIVSYDNVCFSCLCFLIQTRKVVEKKICKLETKISLVDVVTPQHEFLLHIERKIYLFFHLDTHLRLFCATDT